MKATAATLAIASVVIAFLSNEVKYLLVNVPAYTCIYGSLYQRTLGPQQNLLFVRYRLI